MDEQPAITLHLARGGPLYELLRATGLLRGEAPDALRSSIAWIAVAWLPLLAAAAFDRLAFGAKDAFLVYDVAVHVRIVVAVPLLLVGDALLDGVGAHAMETFASCRLTRAGPDALRGIVRRAERTRDRAGPELVLLVLAIFASLSAFFGLFGSKAGLVGAAGVTLARAWYSFVALPISNFLLLRFLWHWLLWATVLFRTARLDVRPMANHPDHAGGLAVLTEPVAAFAAAIAGPCAVLSAAWGTELLLGTIRASMLWTSIAIVVAFVLALGLGPLLVFVPALVRERYESERQYGRLALMFVRLYHERWIAHGEDPAFLDSPHVQSLADLGGSYESMRKMRSVPFSRRTVVMLLVATLTPMLPLVATQVPLTELVSRIAGVLL